MSDKQTEGHYYILDKKSKQPIGDAVVMGTFVMYHLYESLRSTQTMERDKFFKKFKSEKKHVGQ